MTIYPLLCQTIRMDSTTVRVYHQRDDQIENLITFGFNRDPRPGMWQFKVMLATLDPLGLPITASTERGQCADDRLYIPSYKAAVSMLGTPDVLVVGDSKMSCQALRGQFVQGKSRYLCPLNENSLVGEDRFHWINEALQARPTWQPIYAPGQDQATHPAIAFAVECQRSQEWISPEGKRIQWTERIVLARSVQQQQHLIELLERRWQRVQHQLEKWRQPPGRGRKVYRTEVELRQDVHQLLHEAELTELVKVELVQQTRLQGDERWVIANYTRDEYNWHQYCHRLGWRVYAANLDIQQLDAAAIVWLYRQQVLHERSFSRLKTRRLHIQPVFL